MHSPDQGIVVLAINNGESLERVQAVAGQRGYPFLALADPRGTVHRSYGIVLRPTLMIVGPDGLVRAVRVGAHTAGQVRAELVRLDLQ